MANARFDIGASTNRLWDDSNRGQRVTVIGEKFITPSTKIFAIGSCFAIEIRRALRMLGREVYPDFSKIEVDPFTQLAGRLPERDTIAFYDTFVIRQELERAIDCRAWKASDFWSLELRRMKRRKGWPLTYQDPYRRNVLAASMDALETLSESIGRCINEGLAKSDVVIITLGLTECWRNKANGLYVCLGPRRENDEIRQLVEFHSSTFAENYANLNALIDSLWHVFPEKKIVLTVSPVPLGRTWTSEDVVMANLYSKATLRSVAGQICRERPAVAYWPSFEYATSMGDIFVDDGRHVQPAIVDHIVTSFLDAHSASE